jgi:hypothetical protein
MQIVERLLTHLRLQFEQLNRKDTESKVDEWTLGKKKDCTLLKGPGLCHRSYRCLNQPKYVPNRLRACREPRAHDRVNEQQPKDRNIRCVSGCAWVNNDYLILFQSITATTPGRCMVSTYLNHIAGKPNTFLYFQLIKYSFRETRITAVNGHQCTGAMGVMEPIPVSYMG